MRILFDTNVVLDVLLNRSPWVTDASTLWRANDDGRIIGYVTASTITDIFYVARRLKDLELAHRAVRICLTAFEVCVVDRTSLEQAISLPGNDFEDNLQIACASLAGLDAIVTRDKADFAAATITIFTPAEAIAQL